jgi:ATP-dependent Clp protease ATP-binding subunit ClpB
LLIDPEGKYEALEKYGKDLTAMAKAGKLDPVIGRDDEIRRCIQILSRRTKNNPVLIGEPGIGKTSISEGYVLSFLIVHLSKLQFSQIDIAEDFCLLA